MSKKHFYVCSYGGSGSKMLCSALSAYGETNIYIAETLQIV